MSDQPPTSYDELATILGSLGFLVREARRMRQLSQRTAADQIGVANSTVSRLEAGDDVSLLSAMQILEWLHRRAANPESPERENTL